VGAGNGQQGENDAPGNVRRKKKAPVEDGGGKGGVANFQGGIEKHLKIEGTTGARADQMGEVKGSLRGTACPKYRPVVSFVCLDALGNISKMG